MTAIVLTKKALGRPGRLVESSEADLVFADLVLVGVQKVDIGLEANMMIHHGECIFSELVVVVEQGDELSPSQPQSVVGGTGDAAIRVSVKNPNALVLAGESIQSAANPRVRREIIDQQPLPVGV